MAQDWNIQPRADGCAACGRPFEDGAVYCSCLLFGKDGYSRSDRCAECWQQREDDGDAYSSWQGIYRAPAPVPEEALKKETAESLLRRLIEDDDESKTNVVYILGVMLERKRMLVERDIQGRDDGSLIRVYEHRQTGETFLIRDPQLTFDALDAVQTEVAAMLGWKRAGERAAEDGPAEGGDSAEPPAQASAADDDETAAIAQPPRTDAPSGPA